MKNTLIRILSILKDISIPAQPDQVTNLSPYFTDSKELLVKKWEAAILVKKNLLTFPDTPTYLTINGNITPDGVTVLDPPTLIYAGLDGEQNPIWTSNGMRPGVATSPQYILEYIVNKLTLYIYDNDTHLTTAKWVDSGEKTQPMDANLDPVGNASGVATLDEYFP